MECTDCDEDMLSEIIKNQNNNSEKKEKQSRRTKDTKGLHVFEVGDQHFVGPYSLHLVCSGLVALLLVTLPLSVST